MEDWFAINQQVLPANSKWANWCEGLLITFSDTSSMTVSHAYNFRYLSGSYIDFYVKKERLLRDLNQNIPDFLILHLIIVSLPSSIKSSLNQNSIKSTDDLHQKLRKYEVENKTIFKESNFSSHNVRSKNFGTTSDKFRKSST